LKMKRKRGVPKRTTPKKKKTKCDGGTVDSLKVKSDSSVQNKKKRYN